MQRYDFSKLLLGKDLRKVKQNRAVVAMVHDQQSFDELFALTLHHERTLVMRAVDAVEKISAKYPEFLFPHKLQLLNILVGADHKELKWHVAQLVTRLPLTDDECERVWHVLTYWARNKNESKIVRVNALQGLFDLAQRHPSRSDDLQITISSMQAEMIPSIDARIRKLRRIRVMHE